MPSSMDGQHFFAGGPLLVSLPCMFVLLVLLVFYPASLPLQKVTAETKAEMDKGRLFLLNQTAECQKHLGGFREHFTVIAVCL